MTLQQIELLPTKTYPFQVLRYLLQQTGIRQGVVGSGDFVASQKAAGANMSVDIAAGGAWIKGTDVSRQGVYHEVNDAVVNVTGFAAADPTNPRIDQVYLRANDTSIPTGSGDVGSFVIVTGTPTVGATLDNRTGVGAAPPSAMPICDALVPAAATTITTANIRDRRPPSTTLGISIPTTETRTNTAYGKMPTADQVANVEVGPNELIVVVYQATWQESVLAAGRASIFIGANQAKVVVDSSIAPQVQAARQVGAGGQNVDLPLSTFQAGLASGDSGTYPGDVTTGQIVGTLGKAAGAGYELSGTTAQGPAGLPLGGACLLFAAAGTYDVSIQFKASSGNVVAKNRKLWVGVMGAQ